MKKAYLKMFSLVLVVVLLLTIIPTGIIAIKAADTFWTEPMVAAGSADTVVLKSDGTVWACGYNTTCDKYTLIKVQNLNNIIAISTGMEGFIIALKNDGTVWAWGRNDFGQLGDGSTIRKTTPVQVKNLNNIIAISAGAFHSIALKNDGTVWTWGYNHYGQLGDNSTINRNIPVQIQNLNNIIAVEAGDYHTVALKEDKTAWIWGASTGDIYNIGSTIDSIIPTQIQSLNNIDDISAGCWYTAAFKSDGTIWAWGSNHYGQLGDGTENDASSPMKIENLNNVIKIAEGIFFIVVLKNDGTVYAWGQNNYGHLGDGTHYSKLAPVQVKNLDNIIDIATGVHHSVALKSDGTIWTWGANGGYLCDGTTTDRPTPIQVVGENGVGYFNVYGNGGGTTNPSQPITGKFAYMGGFGNKPSDEVKDKATFDYNDNYFDKTSYKYNHDLAKMSLALAMATYDRNELEKIFTKIGFNESNLFYTNNYYKESNRNQDKTKPDDIGVGIASKKIGEYTVVAVSMRGFMYYTEWAGNFTVGNGTYHEGFKKACDDIVYKEITKYLNDYNISGNIKLWIMGYSRAGAVANLLAGRLNKGDRFNNKIQLDNKNIYTYCFEPPAGVKNTEIKGGVNHGNIFNIVNPNDLVPMVAPSGWEFVRYGTDIFLPSKETNGTKYKGLFENMKAEYNLYRDNGDVDLINHFLVEKHIKTLTGIIMVPQIVSQENFLTEVFHNVTKTHTNKEYVDNIQTKQRQQCINAKGLSATLDTLWFLINTQTLDNLKTIAFNSTNIKSAHYADLCYSWINTLDGKYMEKMVDDSVKKMCVYRKVFVNCPVDIEVYDNTNILVAKIINDEPQELPGGSLFATVDENGQKVIYCPTDEEFTFKITATGSGTMTYSVQEYSLSEAKATRAVNFYEVPLTPGKQFESTVSEVSEQTDAAYTLAETGKPAITPSEEMKGEAVQYFSVDADIEGVGAVYGTGSRVKGNFAQLTAVSVRGSEFIGWYAGNTLITDEPSYRFCVLDDVALTARFEGGIPLGCVSRNTKLSVADARMILQHLVGKIVLDDEQLDIANVSGGAKLSVSDARMILQMLVGKISEFPRKV